MKHEIRAIETRYKGYRFRSRLEARWAVFFDALGLKWEYEPEGFHTSAGPYLPDFRVMTPQGKPIWYEIKPEGVTEDAKFAAFIAEVQAKDCQAARADLAREYGGASTAELPDYVHPAVGTRGAVLSGDPVHVLSQDGVIMCPRCGLIGKPDCGLEARITTSHPRFDLLEVMVGCWPCDIETPSGGDNPWEDGVAGLGVYPHKGWVVTHCKNEVLPTFKAAAEKARSARFEHGEAP